MNSLPSTTCILQRLLLAGVVFAIALRAQQTPGQLEPKHTNFSGRWRMVKSQSDFGGFHMPDIVIRVVDQRGATMNVHTVQTTRDKTSTNDLSYFTDGTVTKNVINGRDAESKGFWDGPALVMRTSMKNASGDNELITDRWDLSANHETLTISSHVETPRGDFDMKMVCEHDNIGR
jgi:hypothetical protein